MSNYQYLLQSVPEIEKKLRYNFKNKSLIGLAFVHRSFINENREGLSAHNERLEFLGDAVLGLIISEYLYQKFPEASEGDLSVLRSRLVGASGCRQYLSLLALENYLLLGKGERLHGSRGKETILADLFEALIGAVYLDGGYDSVRSFFFCHCQDLIHQVINEPVNNYKALLQDFAQKNYHHTPTYQVLHEAGPDHQKQFEIAVFIEDNQVGTGCGPSKKEAQQQAAKMALIHLSPNLLQDTENGKS